MVSGWFHGFSRIFMVFDFCKAAIVRDAIFFINHKDQCFFAIFLTFIDHRVEFSSDGRQPSVQRCDICDETFKSSSVYQLSRRMMKHLKH